MTRYSLPSALLLVLWSAAAAYSQPYFQPPTATELFNLRSRCAALGDKLQEEISEHPDAKKSLKSHYDPRTDHCYGELTVQFGGWYLYRTLYDLQTKEILATAKIDTNLQASGTVFGGQSSDAGNDHGFTSANQYIAKMMQEDR